MKKVIILSLILVFLLLAACSPNEAQREDHEGRLEDRDRDNSDNDDENGGDILESDNAIVLYSGIYVAGIDIDVGRYLITCLENDSDSVDWMVVSAYLDAERHENGDSQVYECRYPRSVTAHWQSILTA